MYAATIIVFWWPHLRHINCRVRLLCFVFRFRLTFFRERKVKNKSFSLTLQNFFLPAFKSTKYLSFPCCKATSFYLFKVKVTTFPTCWQKCDLGWLGWLWPGPSSQMEDVIICEACLEVARARPWLHQQLSTAHNSNNTIQTVTGWEVEPREGASDI